MLELARQQPGDPLYLGRQRWSQALGKQRIGPQGDDGTRGQCAAQSEQQDSPPQGGVAAHGSAASQNDQVTTVVAPIAAPTRDHRAAVTASPAASGTASALSAGRRRQIRSCRARRPRPAARRRTGHA
ncbi:MAG: hypothetical protein IPK44_13030 [Candidatus Accumulibacter sp.]|uniref:hypothetical protein n=1 Tax=Accumulibacter sp. TaxID=2053492 RepID=UPI0025889645|nr:hypothetical protein [Accumulibacter sp.]MBK8115378.1 hypothetical protein [Accumulibacter sp.]